MSSSSALFAALVRAAMTDPGIVSTADQEFHNDSLGTQLLAGGEVLA
jgi:hypothetical protein